MNTFANIDSRTPTNVSTVTTAVAELRLHLLTDALDLAGAPRARTRAITEEALGRHHQPGELASLLEREMRDCVVKVIVNGTFEQRLILLQRKSGDFVACSLGGVALADLPWPTREDGELVLLHGDVPVSEAILKPSLLHRLTRPRVTLVALYHPENFPLPRFPLGISDLARAVRSHMIGQVSLLDMQFGVSCTDIALHATRRQTDVLGISATFGQDDILMRVMEELDEVLARPMMIFGGSLSALNRHVLLSRFPNSMVCHGPGEAAMQDLVSHWHGIVARSEIRAVAYDGTVGQRASAPRNVDYTEIVPELDLLERTLECSGVMQLESSRGCTHACSFCPRSHKGRWNGQSAALFGQVISETALLFSRFPSISRKIFLVDEEFVGSDKNHDALARAAGICDLLNDAGFRWETSTRVDQIYRPDRDVSWHIERIKFWSHLRDNGLSRCLFGVESGVDSILRRFNKHTTAEQNVIALRLLTAMGVPIRCTYITFDQLMTMQELVASYTFQGRDDLILEQQTHLDPSTLFDAVHDVGFVQAAKAERPFFSSISYMLVSMEALLGSPYLRKVEEAGLARETQPLMGRRRAEFKDPRIGAMSDAAQRWIDRNFSFDYTLKSIEKVTQQEELAATRLLRAILKRSAYGLLGRLLAMTTNQDFTTPTSDLLDRERKESPDGPSTLDPQCVLDASFHELQVAIASEIDGLDTVFDKARWQVLLREHARWNQRQSWSLINS